MYYYSIARSSQTSPTSSTTSILRGEEITGEHEYLFVSMIMVIDKLIFTTVEHYSSQFGINYKPVMIMRSFGVYLDEYYNSSDSDF